MYAEGISTAGADDRAQDPRVLEALRRLEMQVGGQAVPAALTNLDKVADWYAADFREQCRNYLARVVEDLLDLVGEGVHPLPGVDEERAREAAEEARRQGELRAEVADALAAGYLRVWRSGADDHPLSPRFVEVAVLREVACPVCGTVPPALDRVMCTWGEILLQHERPRGSRPDRREPCPISSVQAVRVPVHCSCGNTFTVGVAIVPDPAERERKRVERERKRAEMQREHEEAIRQIEREQEEQRQQREQDHARFRAAFAAGLQAGRVHVCIDGHAADSPIACPGCGAVPPGLDRVLVGLGRVLDDPAFCVPGTEFPIVCTCGRAFDLAVTVRREVEA